MFYKRSSQILFSKAIGDVEYRNVAERDDRIISWQENWGLCWFRKSIVSTILNGLFSPMLSATHSNGVAFWRLRNYSVIQYALIALPKLLYLSIFQKLLCYAICPDLMSKIALLSNILWSYFKNCFFYPICFDQILKLLCYPMCSDSIIKCRIMTVR